MKNVELSQVDIIEQEFVSHEAESLVSLYGVHIPVLENLTSNEKLFWPFTPEQIKELML